VGGAGYHALSQERETKTATLSVSATVIQDIQIMTVRDIDLRGIEMTEPLIRISPIMDQSAGMMIATGQPGATVKMTFLKDMDLIRTDGPGRLRLTYEVSVFTDDNQRASRLIETIDDELKFNPAGKLYIWIGGLIDLNNANPGNYEGEFTVELDYL
jgi:hypothetical protein